MTDKQVVSFSIIAVILAIVFLIYGFVLSEKPSTSTTRIEVSESSEVSTTTIKTNQQDHSSKPIDSDISFEYKLLSEKRNGNVLVIKLQCADDVAPNVKIEQIRRLANNFIVKYGNVPFDVYFYTVTPLMNPWAKISHIPSAEEKLRCNIIEYAFEMGPWYFPEKLDPSQEWQEIVWITLPIANKIINNATQFDWEVLEREANSVLLDSRNRPIGSMADRMSLSPQTWEICTYDGDVSRFVRTVERSLTYYKYEFAEKIVGKLNSVIGTADYLSGEKHFWEWHIDGLEVTFFHYNGSDSLTILRSRNTN